MVTVLLSRRKGILLQAAAVGCLSIAAGAFGPPAAGQAGDWRGSAANDFPLAGGDYFNQRYSALDQITPQNVKNLRPLWVHQLDALDKAETTPLVVDGIMYATESPSNVIALDTRPGEP